MAKCPKCGNEKTVWKYGIIASVKKGRRQRYFCNNCGHTYYID